jgi:hypothetical protein
MSALPFSCFAIHGHLALGFITRILYFYRFNLFICVIWILDAIYIHVDT